MSDTFKNLLKSLPFPSFFSASKENDIQKVGRGAYAIELPSSFQHIGQVSVSIPLHSDVSGNFPRSTVNSKVYSDMETTLFVQRMSAPVANTYFVPLDGEEFSIWGKIWRENKFSVDAENTTKEFTTYCTFIAEHKLPLRSVFLVKMLDRRISPTSILRVLAFTSDDAAGLPPAPESTSRYSVRKNN